MASVRRTGNWLAPHKLFQIRARYLYTRGNKLRLRYACSGLIAGCACFALIATQISSSAVALSLAARSGEVRAALSVDDVLALNHNGSVATEKDDDHTDMAAASPRSGHANGKARVSEGIRKAAAVIHKPVAPQPRTLDLTLSSGDTLAGVLVSAGVNSTDTFHAIKQLSRHLDPRQVKAGQVMQIELKPDDEGLLKLASMNMDLGPIRGVTVSRSGDSFTSRLEEKELFERTHARQFDIETSLYGSALRAGIPSQIVAEVIRVFSWNVDFQRDIRRGDRLEVMYDVMETDDGDIASIGNVHFANLRVDGIDKPIFRYETADGYVDYFQPDGQSMRKTLMRTPVDGARLSSGYGMRKHPVLGYNKMHKGLDFAAPTGTPIYAAGDGIIERADRFGAYGNYVRIRHNSRLKTAYAHLHKFAKGVKSGSKVKQGEVIGYIGSTGRSTGPHLHYEVMVNNSQVDPRSIDLPTGEQLKGKELDKFKATVAQLKKRFKTLTEGVRLAESMVTGQKFN